MQPSTGVFTYIKPISTSKVAYNCQFNIIIMANYRANQSQDQCPS